MNIYDTEQIRCIQCRTVIGEVECDAEIIRPKCGKCANPIPEGDKILYTVSAMQRQKKSVITSN